MESRETRAEVDDVSIWQMCCCFVMFLVAERTCIITPRTGETASEILASPGTRLSMRLGLVDLLGFIW